MCFAKMVLEQFLHASVPPWITLAILSVLAFQSCWFTAYIWSCSILANSKPDGLFGHNLLKSFSFCHWFVWHPMCYKYISAGPFLTLFDFSEIRCFLSFFLSFFLVLAQFCCWGWEESFWFFVQRPAGFRKAWGRWGHQLRKSDQTKDWDPTLWAVTGESKTRTFQMCYCGETPGDFEI